MTRLPSRDELVAFIRERSGEVGTREIARAFGAKNADRAALNRMLRELAEEGADRPPAANGCITPARCRRSCSPTSPGATATANYWRGRPNGTKQAHGAPPVIHVATPRRAKPGEVAGVGDRALIRIDENSEEETSGRVIKLIDRAKHRMLGIFRGLPDGGGRLVPVDKKQLGRELAIPPAPPPARWTAISSPSKSRGTAGSDCRPHRRRAARFAQERARRQPHRHPRPRYSQCFSARGARRSRSRAAGIGRAPRSVARGLARRAVRHHRSAGRQGSRRRRLRAARSRSGQSRRSYRQRRHRRRGALCTVRLGARPRGGSPRQFGLFSRSRRADAAGAHFQRSVLAAPERGAPGACGAHGDRRRRPQAFAHISSGLDPLCGETALRAGAARGVRGYRRGHRADR